MKKVFIFIGIIIAFIALDFYCTSINSSMEKEIINISPNYNKLTGTIINIDENTITLIDNNNAIYNFNYPCSYSIGDNISIKYNGNLNDLDKIQNVDIKIIKKAEAALNYEDKIINILNNMSLEEKNWATFTS